LVTGNDVTQLTTLDDGVTVTRVGTGPDDVAGTDAAVTAGLVTADVELSSADVLESAGCEDCNTTGLESLARKDFVVAGVSAGLVESDDFSWGESPLLAEGSPLDFEPEPALGENKDGCFDDRTSPPPKGDSKG
jgi:hypothetical protein